MLKLLARIERSYDLAHAAYRRSMQYAGFETGRKARERFEHYEAQFTQACEDLRAELTKR